MVTSTPSDARPQAALLELPLLTPPLPGAAGATGAMDVRGSPLLQVKATLRVCVGEAVMSVGDLLAARQGQVVALDRKLDQVVDVLIEGQVVARGELVAVDDVFGVRITELPQPLQP